MRYIIVGAARSGKTTLGQALAERLGTVATDTSEPIVLVETARQAGLVFKRAPGSEDWDSSRDRPARDNLIALGDALQKLSPTILADYCFSRGSVCVGVRRQSELEAVLAKYPKSVVIGLQSDDSEADNFDITSLGPRGLWMYNPKEGREQTEVDVSMVLTWAEQKLREGLWEEYLRGKRDPIFE